MKPSFLTATAIASVLMCGCSDIEPYTSDNGSDIILFELADFAAIPATSQSDSTVTAPPKPEMLKAQGGTSAPTLYLHSQERLNDGHLLPQYASLSITNNQSRATPVSDHKIFAELYGEFTIEAWCKSQPYINSEKIEAHTESIWRPAGTHYWPATDKVDFYAYAPTSALGDIINIDDTHKEMSFDHTTPPTATQQTDLLVATIGCTRSEAPDGHAPLHFMHPLSAVTFRAKAALPGLTIKAITLSGLSARGYCRITRSDTEPISWSNLSTPNASFSQTFNVTIPSTGECDITGQDLSTTFMVIPQELDQATVTVNATTDKDEDVTLTAPLRTAAFSRYLPGKEYVYCISTNSINWEYHFSATKQVTLNDGAVLGQYNVSSYRQNLITSEKVALKWTGEFDDSARINRYVPIYTLSDNGGESTIYDLKCAPQHLWKSDYPGDDRLKSTTESPWCHGPKGARDPQDLSFRLLEDGSRETLRSTANCYKVHAPGTYAIPLVYGNAIYKGNDNKRAYTLPYKAESGQMQNHRRLGDLNITQPWVDKDYEIANPKEVWEDAPGLIRNVRDSVMTIEDGTEHHFIVFEVPRTNIVQGNAVLAARRKKANGTDGDVVWSWHVWVTDYDRFSFPNVDIESIEYPGRKYRFFTHKLGECARKKLTYLGRQSICKYRQEESGLTAQTIILQNEFVLQTYVPNGTYYQWGRKDPIIGIARHEATSVKPYFIDDIRQREILYIPQVSGYSDNHILYPEKMLAGAPNASGNYTGYPNDYSNAWDNRDKDATVAIKTVYDPSPAGYKIAPDYAYRVFIRQFPSDEDLQLEYPTRMVNPETNATLTTSDLNLDLFNSFLNGTHEYNPDNPDDDRNYIFTVYPQQNKQGTPFEVYATGQRWSTKGHSLFNNTELMNKDYVYIWVSTTKDREASRCFALGYNPGKEISIWVGRGQTGRHSMARPVYYIKHESEEEQLN